MILSAFMTGIGIIGYMQLTLKTANVAGRKPPTYTKLSTSRPVATSIPSATSLLVNQMLPGTTKEIIQFLIENDSIEREM